MFTANDLVEPLPSGQRCHSTWHVAKYGDECQERVRPFQTDLVQQDVLDKDDQRLQTVHVD